MGFDVKITTLHKVFELVCPHYCMGCGELGGILCERCKNDNGCGEVEVCLNCGMVTKNGVCKGCAELTFDRGYVVSTREGLMERCINEYKYKSVRALRVPLAEMLATTLPCLPADTVVVPVPTNRKHVRMRGLDHTLLMGRELARIRGWRCERLVRRVVDSVQVGADRKTRMAQAKEAYALGGEVCAGATYVVVDDVWTTGATMNAVCGVLKRAGAGSVVAIVLAQA